MPIGIEPFTPGDVQVSGPYTPAHGGFLCPSDDVGLGSFENLYPKNIQVTCDATAAQLGVCSNSAAIGTYDPAVAASRASVLDAVTQGLVGNQIASVNLPYPPQFQLLNPNNIQVRTTKTSIITKDIVYQGVADIPPTVGRCTKLAQASTTLIFQDTDKNYFVVGTRSALQYGVRIVNAVTSTIPRQTCYSACTDSFGFLDILSSINLTPTVCQQTACYPTPLPASTTPSPVTSIVNAVTGGTIPTIGGGGSGP
jgi:hypothetical protein